MLNSFYTTVDCANGSRHTDQLTHACIFLKILLIPSVVTNNLAKFQSVNTIAMPR